MSVLELLKKVKVETLSFEKHPCRELDLEIKIHYLNGVALVMNEDGEISEKEKEHLLVLMNSFDLEREQIEEFIEFAQNPDEERVLDMMKAFESKDIKYNFMMDCMMMASIDGNYDDSEKAVIEQYAEMFKISKEELKDLAYIWEMFYTQNRNGLFAYFNRKKSMQKKLFQYLIDYYEMDISSVLTDEQKKVLTFKFIEPEFERGGLRHAKEIIDEPVSNEQFCIFLNVLYNDKEIELNKENNVVLSKSKDKLLSLEESMIVFDKSHFIVEDKEFSKKERKRGLKKGSITGMTYIAVNLFISWLSQLHGIEYKLTHLFKEEYGSCDDLSSKSFDLEEEFYFYNDAYQDSSILYYLCDGIGVNKDYSSDSVSFRFMKIDHDINHYRYSVDLFNIIPNFFL